MKAVLENSNRLRIDSFRNMDSEMFASVFADQGRMLMSGGYIMHGQEIIKKKMTSFMHLVGPMDVTLDIYNCWEIDDEIFEQGYFKYVSIDNGKLFNEGHYLIRWKKQVDGSYKIIYDFEIDMI